MTFPANDLAISAQRSRPGTTTYTSGIGSQGTATIDTINVVINEADKSDLEPNYSGERQSLFRRIYTESEISPEDSIIADGTTYRVLQVTHWNSLGIEYYKGLLRAGRE